MQGEEKVSELLTRVQEAKTSLAEELLAATTLEDCIKLLSSLPHTALARMVQDAGSSTTTRL